jgi:iron complex outermembrane receptor protein
MKLALLRGASAAVVTIAALGASQAVAQTAGPPAAGAAAQPQGQVVVTAERRNQAIERVPVAVSAYTAEQRKLIGIEIIQDLASFTPSMNWTDVDDRVYIRGIGRNSDNLNNTSGVAIYYDGIYYGANASVEQQKSDLFVGNVEIDSGPQNLLHGSNADGGVVSFTSKRPTDTLYAEVRTGVSNYSTYFVEGVVSGPIDDHLKFRLGGNYTDQSGGFFKNVAPGSPQGGDLVLGGGGQTQYLMGQLEGKWDHLDAWVQASSGDFNANTHGVGAVGNFPATSFNGSDTLTPSGFYGLCGLPGFAATANGAGCTAPTAFTDPTIVPGSVVTTPVNASVFPGNNPGNVNPRWFINEMNGLNLMQNDIQVSSNVTYHMPSFDITYLGGFQSFHYVLAIPDQAVAGADAGVISFQENGAANAGAAALCTAAGNSLASCETPLTVYPTPNYLTFDEFDQSFSNEIDFTSTWASPINYVGGLYWYREIWNQPVNAFTTPDQLQMRTPVYYNLLSAATGTPFSCLAAPFNVFSTCPAPRSDTGAGSSENTKITYDSYAAFLQASYKFNDQFKITGGFRWTVDRKVGSQTWRVLSFDNIVAANNSGFGDWGGATPALDITYLAACTQAPPKTCEPAFPGAGPTSINARTGEAQRSLGATWSEPTGAVDLDWTPDSTTLFYARYSRGYKSGGWSTYTLGPLPEVNPEFVDAYEVGAKKTIGSVLTVNGDVFYYNYYGEQVPSSVVNSIGQIVPILYNVPLVHTYGVELWGTWRPIDPLALSLSYSYLNAKIAQASCLEDTTDPLATYNPDRHFGGCPNLAGVQTQSVVGEQIPGATPNKIAFNALYTFSFDSGKLTLSGAVIWRDGTYDDIFNRPYTFQPQNTQVNLRATWTGAGNRYNIIAFVNNVGNATAYDGNGGVLLGTFGGKEDILREPALNEPRVFGVQLQVRWQ